MISRLRQAARAIAEWVATRPTSRRIDRLRAKRIELNARIEAARQAHNTNALHVLYAQLAQATTELIRLERRTA